MKPGNRLRSFTLVEALASLCLGALVTSAATFVTVQSFALRQALERETGRRRERTRLVDQLRRDVEQAPWWSAAPSEILAVSPEDRAVLHIITLAAAHRPDATSSQELPAEVTYSLAPSATDRECHELIREQRDLTDPEATVVRRVVSDGVAAFNVVALAKQRDGTIHELEPAQTDAALAAIQLTCTWCNARLRPVHMTLAVPQP